MSVYIIAESGSCHEQILERALALTTVASEAGATAIKWQFWSDASRMRQRRHVEEPKAFEVGSISETWFPVLREAAHAAGLAFIVTAFLPEDVPLVAQYVDAFKIASFENQHLVLGKMIARLARETGRRVFISRGLTHTWPVQSFMPTAPGLKDPFIQMHCVTAYPCPPDEANLGLIKLGRGYSDHTGVVFAGGLAVAAGANYLEVHVRLDETSPGCPDYPHALTPSELATYVDFAQTAWRMRGSGVRGVIAAEEPNQRYRVAADEP